MKKRKETAEHRTEEGHKAVRARQRSRLADQVGTARRLAQVTRLSWYVVPGPETQSIHSPGSFCYLVPAHQAGDHERRTGIRIDPEIARA